uniref:Uncharacterized protein n=1 Tax=Arundo donax TaxID=35708 RepID=A0A0A9F440_ARUDO
MQELYLWQG